MEQEHFGAFLNTMLFQSDMKSFSLKFYIQLLLSFFFAIVISYNFYVANSHKYEISRDAANFIELEVSLAKTTAIWSMLMFRLLRCIDQAFKDR